MIGQNIDNKGKNQKATKLRFFLFGEKTSKLVPVSLSLSKCFQNDCLTEPVEVLELVEVISKIHKDKGAGGGAINTKSPVCIPSFSVKQCRISPSELLLHACRAAIQI